MYENSLSPILNENKKNKILVYKVVSLIIILPMLFIKLMRLCIDYGCGWFFIGKIFLFLCTLLFCFLFFIDVSYKQCKLLYESDILLHNITWDQLGIVGGKYRAIYVQNFKSYYLSACYDLMTWKEMKLTWSI